jgi:predicted N-acetyltransferase YhbS
MLGEEPDGAADFVRGCTLYRLTQEGSQDRWEVEALYDLCFAPGREALSSYRLRGGVPAVPELCLIARDGLGILAGAIRYWPIAIGSASALLLGPIAVHPTRQGEGLGNYLIRSSLKIAQSQWQRILLVGDAPYYSRFGFEKLDKVIMPPPTNPDRVLGLALKPHSWEGIEGMVTQAGFRERLG